MARASSTASSRLEDIFQEEIIHAFGNITEFKMFARSQNGLCLREADIQGIVDDNISSTDQKMEMLNKWRLKNGKEATVPMIRCLVKMYNKGDDPKDYKSLRENMFGVFMDQPLCKKGNVYLGEQKTAIGSIPRAIKMIPYDEKNFREAEILTKLGQHENIVSIMHVDEFQGDPYHYIYMVMTLAWTEHLRNVLQACKKSKTVLNDDTVIDIAVQISRALAFIHGHKVIHRDLKPENILVSEDRKHVKLTDFGISKIISDGSSTKQTDFDVGTDGYRATETYNSDVISQKSDIFSAGITFGELFSNGRHPFGDDPDLWKYNIKTYQNLDTSHITTTEAENLVIHMLQLKPEKRPTALEVLNALKLFGQSHNQTAVSTTVSDASTPAVKETRSEMQLSKNLQGLSVQKKAGHSTSQTKTNQNQVHIERKAQVAARPQVHFASTPAEANAIVMFNMQKNDCHIYAYTPSTKILKQMQKFPFDDWFASLVLGQHIYIVMGEKLHRLNFSDPAAKCTAVTSIKERHGCYSPIAAFQGSIYVCGGSQEASRCVERFEELKNTNRWIALPPLNDARKMACVVASNDHLYCIGGFDEKAKMLQTVQRFDGKRWLYVEDAPRGIACASATVLEEKLYVADDGGVQCYDIPTNSWYELNLSPAWPFGMYKILNLNNELYAIISKDEEFKIYLLDPSTEKLILFDSILDKEFHADDCLAVYL